jgi:hypothetical protein
LHRVGYGGGARLPSRSPTLSKGGFGDAKHLWGEKWRVKLVGSAWWSSKWAHGARNLGVLMMVSRMPLNVNEKAFGLDPVEGRDITVALGIGASNPFWPCRDKTSGTFQCATVSVSLCSMVFQ